MKNNKNKILDYLSGELDPAFARRARILVSELKLKGKEHVLEIGCGRGFYEGILSKLYPQLTIMAIDQNPTYLSIARKSVQSSRVTFQQSDALNLPWKDKTFDRVFATEVLEHLPDDSRGLQEMYRVLKPGGIAVFTVPNKQYPFFWDPLNWLLERTLHTHMPSTIWWLAGIWADHVRLYSKSALVQRVKAAHFTVEKVFLSTHYSIFLEHFWLYGIGKNIVESGMLPNFYRFNQHKKPSPLFSFLRSILYKEDHKNKDTEVDGVATVNIIVKAKKK